VEANLKVTKAAVVPFQKNRSASTMLMLVAPAKGLTVKLSEEKS
jgi:hypothetical protein